jgi:hypothetical protein
MTIMPAPLVSWYDFNNTLEQTNWAIGTVDAGSESAVFRALIWNNRGGGSPLSDMVNCAITTKDTSGGNTTEVVTGKWIQVQVNSAGEGVFMAIGGTEGVALPGGLTGHEHPIKAQGGPNGEISGAANDGTKVNSALNFADVSLKAAVPLTASAGSTNFLVRIAYQYV